MNFYAATIASNLEIRAYIKWLKKIRPYKLYRGMYKVRMSIRGFQNKRLDQRPSLHVPGPSALANSQSRSIISGGLHECFARKQMMFIEKFSAHRQRTSIFAKL